MKIEQLYTNCLAEAAYYIESNGEVAIIDPLRETEPYMAMARKRGGKIKYILETHFHADFVSGHVDLAKKTGAKIIFGPTAKPSYKANIARDGELLKLGKIYFKVLHTPGHTLESSCFLLIDEKGKNHSVFTGDTLFIGDVGRPDLVQKLNADITPQLLAGYLFDSLREKIMPLGNEVIVYPGHGAGSACGKNMSKETMDTLGHQKQFNYALRADMTRDDFIEEVTTGLTEPPQYFPLNVLRNVKGSRESIDNIIRRGSKSLTLKEFKSIWEHQDAVVLDTRSKEAFVHAHIPGTMFIGVDESFAPWVGTLIPDLKQPILFIADEGREEEVVTRLARVGFDNAKGYLQGGIDTWKDAIHETGLIEECLPEKFARHYAEERHGMNLVDVRRRSEYESGHIIGAENFPLDHLQKELRQMDKFKKYYVHCAAGYRSVIAASILKSAGFHDIVNIPGGYKSLSQTGLEKTKYTAPTSML